MAFTSIQHAASGRPAPHAKARGTALRAVAQSPARQSFGIRTYDVAGLRPDGSLHIGQHKAPALPLFENAFSAFARGTLLASDAGPVAIEDLQPGDRLETLDGGPARVLWIGSSSFVPADAGRRVPLVRIMPDSFGIQRPDAFVTFGPAARLLQTPPQLIAEAGGTRMLAPLQAFIDGMNVIEVVPPTPVHLFHICLERHAVIKAGGLEMESYHPGANAAHGVSFNMRQLFLSLFPHIRQMADFGPLAHPRAPCPAEDQTAA